MTWLQALILTIVGVLVAVLGYYLIPAPINLALLIIGIVLAVAGGIALLVGVGRGGPTPRV